MKNQSEQRIRQLTALIEHADCLLWEAEVEIGPADWKWSFTLHSTVFSRRLFLGNQSAVKGDLWSHFQIDERQKMDQRSQQAMVKGEPGYAQEFRAVRDGHTFWLHENVSITPLGPGRFWLVGLATDITPQREAEAARRQSELMVDRILAHAQCLLWRATVILEDGVLNWPHFDIPHSQFSEFLFGDRVFSPDRGFWDTMNIPEQAEMNEHSTKAILGNAPGYAQQFRAINRAGRLFWLNERVSITRVSDTVWSLVGVVTDFTAQHEAEEARRKSETRLSHLLERADTMIWQAEVARQPDGKLSWSMYIPQSQLYRRIFSAEPDNLLGFAWKKRGVPEHAAMDHRAFEASTTGATAYEQAFHVPAPAGDIWLSEKVTIIATGPQHWDLVGVVIDITARHEAEEARLSHLLELADCLVWEATVTLLANDTLHWDLYTQRSVLYPRIFGERQETELDWHTLEVPEFEEMRLRAMHESVITTDVAGLIQFMNPAAAALTGWQEREASGRLVAEICHLQSGRSEQPADDPVTRVIRGDRVSDLPAQTWLVTRSGQRRLIEGCCVPIHAADSKVIGTVLMFRDVTEQERLEQELVRATRLESVGVLAGGIAHDFNNILTAVMGNLALARLDVPADTPAGLSLHSAGKAALRARDLTQ